MTWGNRFRLMLGLMVVVIGAAFATYHLNESEALAASSSAQIAAKTALPKTITDQDHTRAAAAVLFG